MKRICEFCEKEYNWEEGQPNWGKNNIILGKPTKGGDRGVSSKKFCSFSCGYKLRRIKKENTNIKKYGSKNPFSFGSLFFKNYMINKYGVENIGQDKNNRIKIENTLLKKYNVINPGQIPEVKIKVRNTNLKKYGVENPGQMINHKEKLLKSDFINKQILTKKKNKSFNKSKPEEQIYQLLLRKYSQVERQYRSEQYPFACDFYIPSLDLYIEYQGTWLHGNVPYNENNEEHIKQIELWKSKNTKFYNIAINVWTMRDPLKRKIAKENNLNWIEFFNMKEFLNWYNKI